MRRFDSEFELETHVLGRALLLMVRDDDDGLGMSTRHVRVAAPMNPFEAIRSRLSAVDVAFQGLHAQVHLDVVGTPDCIAPGMHTAAFVMAMLFFSTLWPIKNVECTTLFEIILCPPCGVVSCLTLFFALRQFPSFCLLQAVSSAPLRIFCCIPYGTGN